MTEPQPPTTDDDQEPEAQDPPPKRRPWWLIVAFLIWAGFLTASILNPGGYGDLLAVPVLIPVLVGLLWLWRWEQGRKAAGRVTYGEELARGALSGPFSLMYLLIRGPEDKQRRD